MRGGPAGRRGVLQHVAGVLFWLAQSTAPSSGSTTNGSLGALVVLALFCVDTARNEPRTFISMVVVAACTIPSVLIPSSPKKELLLVVKRTRMVTTMMIQCSITFFANESTIETMES